MSRTIDELLTEALGHFDAATEYAQVTDRDPRMILNAISMRLFAGLETLTRLPDGLADRLFPGDWPDMRGLRHRIAHGYGAVSLTRVKETINGDLPGAVATIFAGSWSSPPIRQLPLRRPARRIDGAGDRLPCRRLLRFS